MTIGRAGGLSPFKRPPPSKPKRRNIFIVCEGASELEYFQALKSKDAYKDCVDVNPVDKFGPDRDDSNRLSMIQLADEYLQFQKDGTMHQRLYVSMTIQSYLDKFKGSYYRTFGKNLKELREKLREEIRDDLFTSIFSFSDYVDEDIVKDYASLSEVIFKKCNTVLGKDENFCLPEDSEKKPDRYESVRDPASKSFVVFDRDYDDRYERGDTDYEKWLRACNDSGVDPVITTPCFELWLYMHWTDNDYGTPSFGQDYAHELKIKVILSENPQ